MERFVETPPIDSMFPIDSLPYEAYCKVIKIYADSLKPFVPGTLEEDLATGKFNRLIYRFPEYMPEIYEWVSYGKNFRDYFAQFNHLNSFLFEDLMPELTKKLDKISQKKENVLGETLIKKSKL